MELLSKGIPHLEAVCELCEECEVHELRALPAEHSCQLVDPAFPSVR